MKLCPTCLQREITDDLSECWDCWHRFLASAGKICSAPDCPQHAPRPSIIERIREWWRWRQIRAADRKHAAIHDREFGVRGQQ